MGLPVEYTLDREWREQARVAEKESTVSAAELTNLPSSKHDRLLAQDSSSTSIVAFRKWPLET